MEKREEKKRMITHKSGIKELLGDGLGLRESTFVPLKPSASSCGYECMVPQLNLFGRVLQRSAVDHIPFQGLSPVAVSKQTPDQHINTHPAVVAVVIFIAQYNATGIKSPPSFQPSPGTIL